MFDRPFWQSIGLRPSLDEERRNINYTPLKRRSATTELRIAGTRCGRVRKHLGTRPRRSVALQVNIN